MMLNLIKENETKVGFCAIKLVLSFDLFSPCRPPLWSSGQSSWLQIQMSGFDSRRYQIYWELVGLEWGPLSSVSSVEELLQRNSSGSGLENWDYGHKYPPRWPRNTPLSATGGITSPSSGGRSVDIVRSRTEATELLLLLLLCRALMQSWSHVCIFPSQYITRTSPQPTAASQTMQVYAFQMSFVFGMFQGQYKS
jgi:hypothetical protein